MNYRQFKERQLIRDTDLPPYAVVVDPKQLKLRFSDQGASRLRLRDDAGPVLRQGLQVGSPTHLSIVSDFVSTL